MSAPPVRAPPGTKPISPGSTRMVFRQFRASLEQDLAAVKSLEPDLAIGTTPVVQAAKERMIPALYFTNLISARPLMDRPALARWRRSSIRRWRTRSGSSRCGAFSRVWARARPAGFGRGCRSDGECSTPPSRFKCHRLVTASGNVSGWEVTQMVVTQHDRRMLSC